MSRFTKIRISNEQQLRVHSTNGGDAIIQPGDTVTFVVPVLVEPQTTGIQLRLQGEFRLSGRWDGQTLHLDGQGGFK